MGGGSDVPEQSATDIELQQKQIEYYQAQIDAANRPLEIPKIEKDPPLPPSPTEVSGDAQDAADAERVKAARRTNTARHTLFAGETGGYQGGRKSTLLG